jgi:6-phosphofructokinase
VRTKVFYKVLTKVFTDPNLKSDGTPIMGTPSEKFDNELMYEIDNDYNTISDTDTKDIITRFKNIGGNYANKIRSITNAYTEMRKFFDNLSDSTPANIKISKIFTTPELWDSWNELQGTLTDKKPTTEGTQLKTVLKTFDNDITPSIEKLDTYIQNISQTMKSTNMALDPNSLTQINP